MTPLSDLVSRSGIHRIKKISDLEYRIDANPEKGMKVPVTIYANDSLISKMATDRTIDQAANVATLPGVRKHVVVLPDGHDGYGFPVGGVAATDMEEGVISPGGVGYDINCGVRLMSTNLTENDLRPKLKDLVNDLINHKVAIEKCEALAAEQQQACKDEADATYEAAKAAADLPGPS